MNPNHLHPASRRRRRVSVEVYFVLYLSAIMLLLGTVPFSKKQYDEQLEQAIVQLLQSEFEVDVERVALIIPIIPAGYSLDTAGIELRPDSLNTIRAHGSFQRVDFNIVQVEDTATGQSVSMEDAALVRDGDSTATFHWRRLAADRNAVYRVTVAATAVPHVPASITPASLRERVERIMQEKGVMRDSVTFTVNVLAITSNEMLAAVNTIPSIQNPDGTISPTAINGLTQEELERLLSTGVLQGSIPTQQFTMTPSVTTLRVPPRGEWRQKVNVFGLDPLEMRSLQLSMPAGVSIVQQTPTLIELSGIAPADGAREITITGKRPNDPTPIRVSFTINTSPLDAPNLPTMFFVGQNYQLKFTSEGVANQKIGVEVIENSRMVLKSDQGGAIINYVPKNTGSVQFTRYIDNQRIDEFDIPVQMLPKPSVGAPVKDLSERGRVNIETVTYGIWNGVQNLARLHIYEGNAEEPVLIDTKTDAGTGRYTQLWAVRKKDPNKDFQFTVYAIDQRGSSYKSENRKYTIAD